MSDDSDQSVTRWISELRDGNQEAARQLWERYSDKVVRLARRKLAGFPSRVADEEDVAQSVFRRLCHVAQEGGFEQLRDRNDLWCLLIAMTSNRAIDQKRYLSSEKRGGAELRGESVFGALSDSQVSGGLDGVASDDASPALLAEICDLHDQLLSRLDEDLVQIAHWKLEDFTNEEIAEKLGITSRSVRRKLDRIREIWLQDNQR